MYSENFSQIDNNLPKDQEPVAQIENLPPKRTSKLPLVLGILALFITVAASAYYLGTKKIISDTQLKVNNVEKLSENRPTISSPKTTEEQTKDWVTQTIVELGLEFKLPKFFGKMDYPNGNETKGEKGKQYCVQYQKFDFEALLVKKAIAGGGGCLPSYFGFGTTSTDYEAGRMGSFGDLQGYIHEDGKYYAKGVMGRKIDIPTELVSKITNPNGIDILKISGKSGEPVNEGSLGGFPIPGTPGEGRLGALINLNDKHIYQGISIEMKLEKEMNEELFDLILSTIKFLPSPTPNDNEAVRDALFATNNWNRDLITVQVLTNDGKYASGTATADGGGGYFYAAKVDGKWKIVADGNGVIFCDKLTNYPDYPTTLIPECYDPIKDNLVKR